jgi:hypothetical protein
MKRSTSDDHVVYAHAWVNKETKRIKLTALLAIDGEGKIVTEGYGNMTIAFYNGRISKKKVKEAIRDFAVSDLKNRGVEVDIRLTDVVYRTPVQIEKLLSRMKSERYENLRRLR